MVRIDRKIFFSRRKIKTLYGQISYGRAYLVKKKGKGGFFPLDAVLGLTTDGFSPLVIDLTSRLATQMSFARVACVMRYFIGWSPSTEAIECFVLGLGQLAPDFMATAPPPENDGDVLIIEIDGKATPTATKSELEKRRGKRRKKTTACCQRHRSQAKRHSRREKKKRRKKGDKSKNGKSITLVSMYTLKRGQDGRLHGPINKRVWGTYAPRKHAFAWARAQATKRGFPSDTKKTVQIVIDGEKCLRKGMEEHFSNAIFTLDVRHLQERIWSIGRTIHPEGSTELEEWVDMRETLLFEEEPQLLLEDLKQLYRITPKGQITKKEIREKVKKTINYVKPRLDMMHYAELSRQDLVIASGVVEGAARYVVGQRMDCAGMRWIKERAEALLHLRCIELNGDWDSFFQWAYGKFKNKLKNKLKVQVRATIPTPLPA